MGVKHRCQADDIGWANGRSESGRSRNERRLSRIDYLDGLCCHCGRAHLAVPLGSDKNHVREIRRHVAWWYFGKPAPTSSVKVWWQ